MGHHYGYVSEQLITGGVLPPRREPRRERRRRAKRSDDVVPESAQAAPRATTPVRPAGTRPRPSTG